MTKYCFTGQLKVLIDKAESGTIKDIDFIMSKLSDESNLAETKFVDFALGLVTNSDGFEQIIHYLFDGTSIQSNYAGLYFNRLGEWKYVKDFGVFPFFNANSQDIKVSFNQTHVKWIDSKCVGDKYLIQT